jgi:hypothetical protein
MKAGSAQSDRDRRTPEAQRIRDDAATLPLGSHFILGGDFNIQSWNEPAYQVLVSSMSDNSGRFFDPIDSPGSATPSGGWNSNAAYRIVHTQDPATCDVSCGGTGCNGGGMDDRFDQLLIADSLMDGAGLDYIGNPAVPYSTMTWDDPNHSYRCWGNDGTSFNCRLTTTGNAMVGAAIAQALITAADGLGHLPVFLDLQLPAKLGAPAAIDFGSVPVGQPATMMITIFNAGDTARFSRSGVAGFDVLTYALGFQRVRCAHRHLYR